MNLTRLLCTIVFVLLAACSREESQVHLVIDADDAVRAQTSTLRVVLAGRSPGDRVWEESIPRVFEQNGSSWPVELTFPPRDNDSSREFSVKAIALDTNDATLIVGRYVGHFTRGKSEVLMMLTADCLSSLVMCSAEQTCRSGVCVDAATQPDAGVVAPVDASAQDAGGADVCVPRMVYRDEDEDGFGVASSGLQTCEPMQGFVESDGDCNDTNRETRPGTAETCDGIDNNCNMQTDEGCSCTAGATRACGTDTGECTSGVQRCTAGVWSATCEGERGAIPETCDARDNDCDGSTDDGVTLTLYRDQDGDGFGDTASVITGCAMAGYVGTAGDCNDSSRTINPSATEACDGINNNCDGSTDEGCGCIAGTTRACGTDTGECTAGIETCSAGTWTGCTATAAATETCDGRDNDCDGSNDDGATCASRPNTTNACTSGACSYTCRADYGDCDSTPSNGCEASLLSDARNCGRCGNSCGTGTCVAGTCTTTTVASWCTTDFCDISATDAPSARDSHTAVWTGSEMLVWGGYDGSYLNTGARFNPSTNTWTALPTTGALPARNKHTAVWTGSEMIIWGGQNAIVVHISGARFNPSTNTWTALPTTTGVPSARKFHAAVWTGSEMLVWGGNNGSADLNTGARFNPSTNTWTALPTAGAPSARNSPTAVWTGSEMLVWGGTGISVPRNTGALFNPSTNTWTALDTAGAPSAGYEYIAVWTGSEMLVWGGSIVSPLNTGARFSLSTNTWTALPTAYAPSARSRHTAVWTGSEMLVWGGYDGRGRLNTGARFNPSTNAWAALPPIGAPSARDYHTAVWTGSEMLIWGGFDGSSRLNTGWIWQL